MKNILLLVCLISAFSCQSDKVILLPEISNAQTTVVNDVSAAYIFFNETQPDSVELNRKNLISTTNWLVNVDKRLTLEQALPKVKFIQDKKRNAKMHKNESAKNYYSCNDTAIKNLGFMEFTPVIYQFNAPLLATNNKPLTTIRFIKKDSIIITHKNQITPLKTLDLADRYFTAQDSITLCFNKHMTFQEYITFKKDVEDLETKKITINPNEFIY
ncbi:MAG: hypothetical protein GYB39_09230 [Algicola sp.]|nr:hypothetical protein [Algicola sp.]